MEQHMNLSSKLQIRNTLTQAKALLKLNQPQSALLHTKQLLKSFPNHIPTRLLHAKLLLLNNQTDTAIKHLETTNCLLEIIIRRQPLKPRLFIRTHNLLAKAYLQNHDPQHTIEQYTIILTQHPDHYPTIERLANLHLSLNEPQQTIHLLNNTRSLPAKFYKLLQQAYTLANQPAKALKAFQNFLRLHPARVHPTDMLQLAHLYQNANRPRDAYEAFSNLAEHNPKDTTLHLTAAELALDLGANSACNQHLHQATPQSKTHHAKRHNLIAKQQLTEGNFPTALRSFFRSHQANPNTTALAGMFTAALFTKRPALTQRIINRTTAETRQSSEWQHNLQTLHPLAMRGALLNQTINQTLKQTNTSPSNPNTKSTTHSPLNLLLNHAAETLTTATAQHPKHADKHYHLANIQFALNQPKPAKKSIKTALKLNPEYTLARELKQTITQPAA